MADEVWLATALLHREWPEKEGFSSRNIVERAHAEGWARQGVQIHVYQHCVATKEPNPGRYCMLTELPGGRRRLFRPGDPVHPGRQKGKTKPYRDEIPERWWSLLDWYAKEWVGAGPSAAAVEDQLDPGYFTLRHGELSAQVQLRNPDDRADRVTPRSAGLVMIDGSFLPRLVEHLEVADIVPLRRVDLLRELEHRNLREEGQNLVRGAQDTRCHSCNKTLSLSNLLYVDPEGNRAFCDTCVVQATNELYVALNGIVGRETE